MTTRVSSYGRGARAVPGVSPLAPTLAIVTAVTRTLPIMRAAGECLRLGSACGHF